MGRLVDNSIVTITIDKGICNQCEHLFINGITCIAYPKGIPDKILTGEINHRKPYKGDNGIQFEARETVL